MSVIDEREGGENEVSENSLINKPNPTDDLLLEENGISDSPVSSKLYPKGDHPSEVSDPGEQSQQPSEVEAMDDSHYETEQSDQPPDELVSHLSPVSEVAEEENPSVEELVDSGKCAQDSVDAEVKQNVPSPSPTPVFEDITDDDDEDDSDGDTGGDNNIELELDDLIEPAELEAEPMNEEENFKKSSDSPVSDEAPSSQDQAHSPLSRNPSKSVISEDVNNTLKDTTENNFTLLKSTETTVTTVGQTKIFPRQKVTARKSGRPVSQCESAPLKTINLHPIKDITMDVSQVEDALYLSKSSNSPGELRSHEFKESSSTENSVSINDIKPSLGGRKKRRKKSYDLPGCRKRMKKIRSDAESIGSSADSMSLADSVSLSDGDFQEGDSHKDLLGLTNDSSGAKREPSPQCGGAKVESALDILTKNSHLGFGKKPKQVTSSSLLASSLASLSSPSVPSSRKHLFPPSKPGSSAKKTGKIKSVLDMLHRRSQQRAETAGESVGDSAAASTSESSSSSNNNGNAVASQSGKHGAGTTTTTICVTSSESSTTTTIVSLQGCHTLYLTLTLFGN